MLTLQDVFRTAEAQRRFPNWCLWLLGIAFAVWAIGSMVDAFPWQRSGDVPAAQPDQQTQISPAAQNPLVQETQPEVVVPSTSAFTERLDWQFRETEIHSLYKETRPLFMQEFTGWFRTEDGSIRPIAEFTGNSMSDEDRLGVSVDGMVFARDDRISIDGAKHWILIDSLPSSLDSEGPTWGLGIRGALRKGGKVILYGAYDYSHKEAGISATKWYQVEMPAATLEELSR